MRKYFIMITIMLIALLQFTACGPEDKETLSADAKETIGYFPQNAVGLGYVNFEQIRKSPFFEAFMDSVDNNHIHDRDLREIIEKTGFDIRKDFSEIYAAVYRNENKDKPGFLAVIKGKFDERKIMNFIDEEADSIIYSKEKYLNQQVYNLENEDISVAFVSDAMVIAGKQNLVRDWLERHSNNEQNALSPDLSEILDDLRYKSGAWMISNTKPFMDEIADQARNTDLSGLESLQGVGFSMKLDNRLQMSALSAFSDAEKSELFRDAIKGLIAGGKLAVSEDRDLVDILNKIDITLDDKRIFVDFSISKEEVEQIIARKDELQGTII